MNSHGAHNLSESTACRRTRVDVYTFRHFQGFGGGERACFILLAWVQGLLPFVLVLLPLLLYQIGVLFF